MEATNTIRAVRYIPGMAPHQVEVENTLEAMQSAVGGDIEAITLKKDLVLICDEEGKMKRRVNNLDATALLVRNYPRCKDHIVGVALLVGAGADGEFTDWDHGGMPPFVLDVR